MLAYRYCSNFFEVIWCVLLVSNLTHFHHVLTRIVYEYLLQDDRVPAPSIFSPLQPYSHPKADVCVCRRGHGMASYVDVKIGDITYVFEQGYGMCP